jgi:hypothetical protein
MLKQRGLIEKDILVIVDPYGAKVGFIEIEYLVARRLPLCR